MKVHGILGVNKAANPAVGLSVGADTTATNSYGLEVCNAGANTRFLVDGVGSSFFYKSDNAVGMKFDASSGAVNIGGKDYHTHQTSVDSLQIGYALNLYEDYYNTGTDNYVFLANNAYYSSGGNKYMRTDEASRFYQNAGNFYFQNAPSGTAGTAISFATRMSITAAGLVGIGRVPAFAQLEVQGDKTLANSLQLQLNGATDSNKQMIMGFDTTANRSYIISQIAGSARKELQMNVETLIVDNLSLIHI